MSDIGVLMVPHWSNIQGHTESGIKRVVEKYFAHLPSYGIKLVGANASSFDLLAVHAGMSNRYNTNIPLVAHVHGSYWTDYPSDVWMQKANRDVTESIRHADVVTVPSEWVSMFLRRDMHLTPRVVPHGVDWAEWQEPTENQGYVLWNKNRGGTDACDPRAVIELAQRFPEVRFLTTFAPDGSPPNVKVTGAVPHDEMQKMILGASVYLATTKETAGIGTLEAMAAGLPILGNDWGGTKDLVQHGVNGYLARPGDFHDLAGGLEFVLTHRGVLGENSREMAKSWTWEKACAQVAETYREAVRLWQDIHSRPFTMDEALYRVQDTV